MDEKHEILNYKLEIVINKLYSINFRPEFIKWYKSIILIKKIKNNINIIPHNIFLLNSSIDRLLLILDKKYIYKDLNIYFNNIYQIILTIQYFNYSEDIFIIDQIKNKKFLEFHKLLFSEELFYPEYIYWLKTWIKNLKFIYTDKNDLDNKFINYIFNFYKNIKINEDFFKKLYNVMIHFEKLIL